jgi:hypothetical protein
MRKRINILVGVDVAVLLAGLLVVCVPRVQQAATRMSCTNNLKQLGLGLTNYHDTYRAYPAATIPCEGLPPERRLSWLVEMVPFVDQIGLVLDRTKAWDAEENLEPKVYCSRDEDDRRVDTLGEYRVFRCPSNPAVAGPSSPGLTDYVGITGVGASTAGHSMGYPGIGFFGYDRRARQEDIKDGTAATIAVIETTRDNGLWTAGGYPTVRCLDPNGGPYFGAGGQFGANHLRGDLFALKRPTTTNVLFVDCSVRILTDSIKPEVFEALATIAGGEQGR